MLIETKIFPAADMELALMTFVDVPFIVTISFGGNYWDCREFAKETEARLFMADPFGDIRAQNDKAEARRIASEIATSPYYAADYPKISFGRKLGPKPRA